MALRKLDTVFTGSKTWTMYRDDEIDPKNPKTFAAPWPTTTRQLTERIAYLLWETAGHPHGRSEEFWFEAERIMDQELHLDLKCPTLMDKGYFYCPHPPLEREPTMLDVFVPRKGLLTRYGKKLREKREAEKVDTEDKRK